MCRTILSHRNRVMGVNKNISEAIKWWDRAAHLGSKGAQHNLGLMYFLGQGVEKNLSKAREYYLSAAKQGSKEAQNSLGFMYFEGTGVKKDLIEAYAWFQLAAITSDYDQAKLNSSIVEANLSAEELQEARAKAKEYISLYAVDD